MNNEVSTTPLGEPMWEGEVTYSMAQMICNGLERIKPENLESVLKRFAFEWLAVRQENAALRAERDAQPEKKAPVQGYSAGIPWSMHLRAYDVYCKKYGQQKALLDLEGRNCRGGFGVKELDEFIPGWRDELSENAQLRANLAIADEHIGTLKTDLGKMADALARMQGPINKDDKDADGKWADDNKKTELTFEDGYSALIAARAGKGNESR